MKNIFSYMKSIYSGKNEYSAKTSSLNDETVQIFELVDALDCQVENAELNYQLASANGIMAYKSAKDSFLSDELAHKYAAIAQYNTLHPYDNKLPYPYSTYITYRDHYVDCYMQNIKR